MSLIYTLYTSIVHVPLYTPIVHVPLYTSSTVHVPLYSFIVHVPNNIPVFLVQYIVDH